MPSYDNTTNVVPSAITTNEQLQTTKLLPLKTKARNFLTFIKDNKKFFPSSAMYNSFYNQTNAIIKHPPLLIESNVKGSYNKNLGYDYYGCWFNWFGIKLGCKRRSIIQTHYTWTTTINNNFDTDIANKISFIDGLQNQMNVFMFNDCTNPNTLLDTTGLQQCNYENTVDDSYSLAEEKQQISQDTMKLLSDTDDFPQYKQANNMNTEITNDVNWKFTNKINSQYPQYNYQYDNLKDLINTRTTFLNNSYNNCDVPGTSLTSVDNSGVPIPPCVNAPFYNAYNQCNKAYQDAEKYQYGSDKLNVLWGNVSNSLPGNTIGANRTILNNTEGSCKKWVAMFNKWQEKEDAALAAPCIPERPISSASDSAIEALIMKFTANAEERINNVNNRVETLKEKMVNYPNILQLKSENVLQAPYGMNPTAVVKNNTSDFGKNVPTQYLEMIIPNGEQGDAGEVGTTGMKGFPGTNGPNGAMGVVGNVLTPF